MIGQRIGVIGPDIIGWAISAGWLKNGFSLIRYEPMACLAKKMGQRYG